MTSKEELEKEICKEKYSLQNSNKEQLKLFLQYNNSLVLFILGASFSFLIAATQVENLIIIYSFYGISLFLAIVGLSKLYGPVRESFQRLIILYGKK